MSVEADSSTKGEVEAGVKRSEQSKDWLSPQASEQTKSCE